MAKGKGEIMSKREILYRMIESKKAERDNLLVALDRLVLEINFLTAIYNKFSKEGLWTKNATSRNRRQVKL